MKRTSLLLTVYLLLGIPCFAQFKEMDASKEIFGLKLYQKADYAQLKFDKTSPNGGFNLYKVTTKKKIKAKDYSITEAYAIIDQGFITEIDLLINDTADVKKVARDLDGSGFEPNMYSTYNGKNLNFQLSKMEGKPVLMISGQEAEKEMLPKVKDTTGIIEMLGKKFTDSTITQLMATFSGKPEKTNWVINAGYDLTWKNDGVVISFTGLGDDAVVSKIAFYLDAVDGMGKIGKKTVLPYGITQDYDPTKLLDKFGIPAEFPVNYYPDYKFDVTVFSNEIKVLRVY